MTPDVILKAIANGQSFTIAPDGTVTAVTPADGKKFTLAECQALVGGYIELIPMNLRPKSWKMLADDDGKPKKLPVNHTASALCLVPGTVVVGTVLVTRHV